MTRKLLITFNLNYFFFVKLCVVLTSLSFSYAFGQGQAKGGKVSNTTIGKPVTGDSYAIVFGISNYPGLTPLKYADKDAALFRDFLETPAGGNTKPENIFYRVDEAAKAADFNVRAYAWLKGKDLKQGDRLYIYFSGHGDAMNEDNYFLLPYDCAPNKDTDNYLATGRIEMYQVKTMFIKPLIRKKVEVLLIVDACRTNELPGGEAGQAAFVNDISTISEQKEGEIIMLSTGAGQSAIESPKIGAGHGLFTWYLVDGLSGNADKEGDAADHDGKVSLAEITSFVKNRVRKEAKTVYNTDQVPVFLSPDKDLETIAVVDSGTYANWKLTETMLQQTDGGNNVTAAVVRKPGKKSVTSHADTVLIKLDNEFIAAVKAGRLTGDRSAESFYLTMKEKWPDLPITQDAKYTLATEYINFGQDKINLFLSGKGTLHIQRMENEISAQKKAASGKNIPTSLTDQVDRMMTLSQTGFDKAATMMEKAVELLQNDPELLDAIYPKLYFLKAASYDRVNNVTGKRMGIQLLRKAIKKDSMAAYNYLMIGRLFYDLNNDSCELYFKKANKLASKWADPENNLANYYGEKKEYQLAIKHYEAAVALDSLDALAVQNIGVLYSNENMLDSARSYFMKSLAINPCDHYANCNMGSINVGQMKHNSITDPHYAIARDYFKKSIACDSSFSRPYILLGRLYEQVNRLDSSLYYAKLGVKENPQDAALYIMLGDDYFNSGDTTKSELVYKQGLAADSLDIYNYTALIWLYRNAGLFAKRSQAEQQKAFANAIFYSEKAIKVEPLCAYAYNALGDVSYDLNKIDVAIPYYEKAVKIDTTYSEAFDGLGTALYRKGDYEKALVNFKKTIALDPKNVFAYCSIGDYYNLQKDYKNALLYYQKAIVVDSSYRYPYIRSGNTLIMAGEYRNAIDFYKRALKLDTGYARLWNDVANAYFNLKSYDTAIVYNKKAIALAPKVAYYYNDMGACYADLNKTDEAIPLYEKAIELDSTMALPYSNLAYIYKSAKEYDKALVYYKNALKFSPNNRIILDGIGDVYRDRKEYKDEVFYYKKALDLDTTQTYYLQDLGFAYIHLKMYKAGLSYLQKLVNLFPNDPPTVYNMACGYSLTGDSVMGIKTLKIALDKGFKDYDLLLHDADMENLRKQPDFASMMKQYFPDKAK